MHILLRKHVNLSSWLGNDLVLVRLLLDRVEIHPAKVVFDIHQTLVYAMEGWSLRNHVLIRDDTVSIHLNPELLLVLADIQ